MVRWFMVTIVGKDRPGIVAGVSRALFDAGCNLGEASMTRLGGNFTVMLMVGSEGAEAGVESALSPLCRDWCLRLHVDPIEGELHRHVEPNARISVHGADRAGIVAEVTGILAEKGFNILNLESDVGGTPEQPVYIMHIEGAAPGGADALRLGLESLMRDRGIAVHVASIDLLLG